MRSIFISVMLALVVSLVPSEKAEAACTDNDFIDPISDVAWDCIFPISIMGVPVDSGDHPPDSTTSNPFCQCPGQGIVGVGFMVEFWEPARMIETVADSWCFPALGTKIDGGGVGSGYVGGGSLTTSTVDEAYQNYHYYIMPLWAILDLFTDIPCITSEQSFDLAMVSELRPDWHDDIYALQLFPETAIFSNPGAILACSVDALASTFQRPIDALYWCMGSWGLTYPATGNITATDYVAANAGIAGRAMFVQARTALLPDRAVNICSSTPMPIWVKSHWRIQQTDPVVDKRCHTIGHPGIIWTHRKNPIGKQDNFAWLLFRKVRCCVVVF